MNPNPNKALRIANFLYISYLYPCLAPKIMQKKQIFLILLSSIMTVINNGCSGQVPDGSSKVVNRLPAAAGRFYSDDPAELKQTLHDLFARTSSSPSPHTAAIISPHAGYIFSGEVAAAAYARIDPNRDFDNVFVIASSHQIHFMGASIYNRGDYVTPLGTVPVNIQLADSLIKNHPVFQFHPEADKTEHSLEVQIPFLQYHMKKSFNLVPIVLGTQSPETCRKIAEALLPYFTERNLFVISTDFSHYPVYSEASRADSATCEAILTGDPDSFLTFLDSYKRERVAGLATNCCGWTSVTTLLYMTSRSGGYAYSPVLYRNSGDSPYGDRRQVVGYWAIAVERNNPKPGVKAGEESSANGSGTTSVPDEIRFSPTEQAILLSIARKTIQSWIRDRRMPEVDTTGFTPNLKLHAGAFVTLRKRGQLRGCIGRFTTDIPLWKVVEEMAVSSSTEDYRFNPVSAEEIDKIDIEISVLTPMRKISSPDEIILGKHGIYIKKGRNAGTFLPQVATETGWNLEEYLGHCSQDKAGIGWDGWKTADVFVYEAIVFSENDR